MKKILFVDDEKELHQIINDYFPRDQFRVICAADGLEGIQKCRNEDFDLIILDYKMPKLDGVKFYKQLREIQEARKAELSPVVFVSGFIDEVKNQKMKFEKVEFLNKPFSKEDLFEKISKFAKSKTPAATIKVEGKITLNPGEVLFREGDEANCLYFVVSGVLEGSKVSANGTHTVIGQIGTGEVIGEMAVLNDDKRILTVTAIEKSELMMIPADKILAIMNGQPKWIKVMIETLSKRLRNTIKQIA